MKGTRCQGLAVAAGSNALTLAMCLFVPPAFVQYRSLTPRSHTISPLSSLCCRRSRQTEQDANAAPSAIRRKPPSSSGNTRRHFRTTILSTSPKPARSECIAHEIFPIQRSRASLSTLSNAQFTPRSLNFSRTCASHPHRT